MRRREHWLNGDAQDLLRLARRLGGLAVSLLGVTLAGGGFVLWWWLGAPANESAARADFDGPLRLTVVLLGLALTIGLGLSGVVYAALREIAAQQHALHARTDELAQLNADLEDEINVRSQIQDQLNDLAARDPLTGLYNRRHVLELLEIRFAEARRRDDAFSVCLCDLDNLKTINDTLGHVAGDEAITAFARLLSTELRVENVAGRYGGDEFVVLFPGSTEAEALVPLQRVCDAYAAMTVESRGRPELQLGASFGVAARNDAHRTASDLLIAADRSLYEAKAATGANIALGGHLVPRGRPDRPRAS